MKNKSIYIIIIVLVIVITIVLFFKKCQNNTIASYFEQNDEGWTVVGDAQESSSNPNYESTSGNPDGYIWADDNATGGTWYWSAPEKFLGNRISSYKEKITFSLKQSSVNNQFDNDDIILFSNDKKIVFNTLNNPDTSWTDYSVPLNEEVWQYNTSDKKSVSKKDFTEILNNLTGIYIRGEYVEGKDNGGIDNVILYTK